MLSLKNLELVVGILLMGKLMEGWKGGLSDECLYGRGAVGVGLAWSEYVSSRSRKMVEGVDFVGDRLTSKEGEVLGRDSHSRVALHSVECHAPEV